MDLPRTALWRYLWQMALLTFTYVVSGKIGLTLAIVQGNVSSLWPPAGIALACLLLFGTRLWPAVTLGALLVNLSTGAGLGAALGIAAGNTAEVLAGAWLMRVLAGQNITLNRLQDALALILGAALVSTPISAALGTASLWAAGALPQSRFTIAWVVWVVGDVMGMLVFTPLLLTWSRPLRLRARPRRAAEALVAFVALGMACVLVFDGSLEHSYLLYPFIIWTALRFGPRGGATATFLVAVFTLTSSALRLGPLAETNAITSLIFTQTYLGVLAITSLILSTMAAQRTSNARALQFLSEAGRRLADSLDPATTLQTVCTLAVPHLADWCTVELAGPDGAQRQESRYASPAKAEIARAYYARRGHEALPPALLGGGALAPTTTQVLPRISPQQLKALLNDPEQQHVALRLRPISSMRVPLNARGRQLGAITLTTSESGRYYDQDDVALAEELARRAAQALDNAVLYQDAQQAIRQKEAEIGERQRVEVALRDSERRLFEAQKMESIGRLAGGIAHDFNNLLTVIVGYIDLILFSLSEDHEARGDLAEVRKATDRATRLTRQLLAFARRQVLEPRVVSLNDIVGEMERMLRHIGREDIDLTIDLAPDLGMVRVDPTQIEQVIVNLVLNARDAMPGGGRLTIETRNCALGERHPPKLPEMPPGEYVRLRVRDTGIGMERAVQERLFEPFFTTKEQGKGTGLGLATSYGIVQQSNGFITFASAPGDGTTFEIYFPLTNEAPEAEPTPADTRLMPAGAETVLLVEDERPVREMVARVLRAQGYTVMEAADGLEALEIAGAARDGGPDLLLTDVVMPRMDGTTLVRQLVGKRPDLKVLFFSGYADDSSLLEGRLDANYAFLTKPFMPETLVQKVREVLDA